MLEYIDLQSQYIQALHRVIFYLNIIQQKYM